MKQDQSDDQGTRPRLIIIFPSLMLVVLLAALDQTIVSTALSTITGDLGGLAYLSWVVTGYLLATTVVTPLYGKLGDLYGRKVMLQAGITVFLLGSITYLPVYLQVVQGASPSVSGLLMAPLMGGLIVTSTVSGQIISRIGRYRPFPIIGTALMTFGLYLLSQLQADAAVWVAPTYMLVHGLGMGLIMQVLVLAVQNAVDFSHLGVATSGTTLFRQIGGSIGVSLYGTVFASQLLANLVTLISPDVQLPATADPAMIAALPPAMRDAYAQAVTSALKPVFVMATILA